MKHALFTTVTLLSLATGAVFGQGTVNFANDSVALSSPPDRLIRFGNGFPGFPPGTPAYGTNLQVQLYYGTSGSSESSLIPLTAAPARLRVSTSSFVGTWQLGGFRTFQTAAPGAQLTLQLRLWDINYGATWEAAMINPGNSGLMAKSALFGYVVPQFTEPPTAFSLQNFLGFTIDIPEPTSFALAGLGAAALWLFRRRKLESKL